MVDLVGTCPKDEWREWLAEGDAAAARSEHGNQGKHQHSGHGGPPFAEETETRGRIAPRFTVVRQAPFRSATSGGWQ